MRPRFNECCQEQVENPVSRSETLRLIETELTRTRDRVKNPADDVLRYLIDLALSETQSKNISRRGERTKRLPIVEL